jgi:hypothetical protein
VVILVAHIDYRKLTKIHTHDFFELLIENFYDCSIIFFAKYIPRLFALEVGRGEKAVTLENLEFRMLTFVPKRNEADIAPKRRARHAYRSYQPSAVFPIVKRVEHPAVTMAVNISAH